ncbi:piggyBac transposable element-derived protein 4-like [Dermacentor andersoni]|uniref:piggyBac transposable element-derived protein 4-like n=1 Tax=Dermacentor andersoni TaxID=34620 RepID=UPI003B3BE782
MHILDRPTYSRRDGSWEEVTPLEMLRLIGIIIYMGVVEVPRLHLYWRSTGIFSNLLPRNIMPRDRFFALLSFLSVGDPEDLAAAASVGKTWRVSWLLDHINQESANLFQPQRDLAVDERMVKSKARSGIRQYIRDKVTKFGYKLWVLADSRTGYTLQFSVYTGKREAPGPHGLAFDVVTKLCTKYLDQGYRVYMDNFYTSKKLFEHLLEHKTLACGTTRKDRRCFPVELKDSSWEKSAERGDVRWIRDGNILYMQWKDRRAVNLMSTIHTANEHVPAKRREKRGRQWALRVIRKPLLVHEYNAGMLGVDKSDQIISTYNVLRKCVRWWKTLFFHCVDIACVNSFILFQQHRKENPAVGELSRSTYYDQLAFREELIEQIFGYDEVAEGHAPFSPPFSPLDPIRHQPKRMKKRRNCKICYQKTKTQNRTNVMCSTCEIYLCFLPSRDCFTEWHSRQGC